MVVHTNLGHNKLSLWRITELDEGDFIVQEDKWLVGL